MCQNLNQSFQLLLKKMNVLFIKVGLKIVKKGLGEASGVMVLLAWVGGRLKNSFRTVGLPGVGVVQIHRAWRVPQLLLLLWLMLLLLTAWLTAVLLVATHALLWLSLHGTCK